MKISNYSMFRWVYIDGATLGYFLTFTEQEIT